MVFYLKSGPEGQSNVFGFQSILEGQNNVFFSLLSIPESQTNVFLFRVHSWRSE
jgi:hypothetical protein